MLLDVRVIPRAKKTEFAGVRDGAILVRVAAPPVDNAANDALLELFASALGVPRKQIQIVAGERGRRKRVSIDGVSPEHVRAILGG